MVGHNTRSGAFPTLVRCMDEPEIQFAASIGQLRLGPGVLGPGLESWVQDPPSGQDPNVILVAKMRT